VLETTLAVSPPAPANAAVAVPALTPQEFLFSALLDGPQPATAVEQHGARAAWVAAEGAVQGPAGDAREGRALRLWTWGILVMEVAGPHDRQGRAFPPWRVARLYRGPLGEAVSRWIGVFWRREVRPSAFSPADTNLLS
jgi:hypothetical protein